GLPHPRAVQGRAPVPAQLRDVALACRESGDRVSGMRRRADQDRGAPAAAAGGRPQALGALLRQRGTEELYDVRSDPVCLKNLAEDPARRAVMDALREQLFRELKEQQDPRMSGN